MCSTGSMKSFQVSVLFPGRSQDRYLFAFIAIKIVQIWFWSYSRLGRKTKLCSTHFLAHSLRSHDRTRYALTANCQCFIPNGIYHRGGLGLIQQVPPTQQQGSVTSSRTMALPKDGIQERSTPSEAIQTKRSTWSTPTDQLAEDLHVFEVECYETFPRSSW
jgi:hypothetical protein